MGDRQIEVESVVEHKSSRYVLVQVKLRPIYLPISPPNFLAIVEQQHRHGRRLCGMDLTKEGINLLYEWI